ncbi:MAG: glycoside hydrolase family 5 protein [Erysipelotrichaceae bacterium]|nr:glycoside hydrolase family 5 protein [Erysipelotrichaceae bacterium]
MKKLALLILCLLFLAGCSSSKTSFDGKDRPSSRGQLQVVNNVLSGEDGKPVMLRGISHHGISLSGMYINADTYHDISSFMGCNVIRLALYTWGVGVVGYSTGGDKNRLYQDVIKGVEAAEANDMYAIVDWHILEDGDPNRYIEDALDFFARISADLKDKNNVLYEICNEPNKTDWATIKKYAEQVIPVIRENDPDAVIIVGTPNWSQDVDVAANDPLDFDNLLYTLHFYSATHKQPLRDKAKAAIDKGLPLFVTEFGICSSSGGFPIDQEEANVWIDFLEENKISYVMWNFSKTGEACAALRAECKKTRDYVREDLSESGLWLVDTIAEKSK